jgi:zinc/manganese transport system substrate-binding protein
MLFYFAQGGYFMQNVKSKITKLISFWGLIGVIALLVSACSNRSNSTSNSGKVSIITTTNVYADIAKNVVGKYGTAKAIISNSSTDPHDFEPTTADAKELTKANIIVANGLGYDSWMNKLASSVSKKPVLVGEDLMGLKKGDNPHIWYNLSMPTKYVNYLVKRLSKLDKKHAAYFKANGDKYLAKINQVKQLVKTNKKNSKPVFVSEPVFDYALKEAGYKIGDKGFEEAIENGTDPSPKMINQMNNEIKAKKIAFFVNNTQASSSTVKSFVKLAKENNIPVLNVRETIPNHTTYLAWMKENYQNLAKIEK